MVPMCVDLGWPALVTSAVERAKGGVIQGMSALQCTYGEYLAYSFNMFRPGYSSYKYRGGFDNLGLTLYTVVALRTAQGYYVATT